MRGSRLGTFFLLGLLGAGLAGCGGDDGYSVPESYAYESRFVEGASSVKYDGQTFRHVLIADLASHIGGLTAAVGAGTYDTAADGAVVATLDYFLEFDSVSSGGDPILLTTGALPTVQAVYDDISTDKNLVDKLAGNDTATDHRDWSTEFVGWSDVSGLAPGADASSPTNLLRAFFETLEDNVLDRVANGPEGTRFAPDGTTPLPVHVTENGLDLQQLTQKLLLMGVAFSQGVDDYLDDDVAGKGLLCDNVAPESDGATHTALEHAWDEAFGYFGAAHDYGAYTDAELSAQAYQDADGDGSIDLLTEYSFGQSINASKRDDGAVAPTDFSANAFEAFLAGRALITHAGGPLSASQQEELAGYRDAIVLAWEQAIAATIVHYINEVLVDMSAIDTIEYSFLDHAKHFSELKGFALGLQFNPRSQLTDAEFVELHTLIGDAPVLELATPGEQSAYRDDLLAARALVGSAYGFDAANLGDDDGLGGW